MNKLLLFFFALGTLAVQAQEFEVGLKAGATFYHGDASASVLDFEEINYGAGLFARYHFDHNFAFKAAGNYQLISGNDANSNQTAYRGLSFESTIIDFSISAEWNFLGVDIYDAASRHNNKFTPYAFLGVGVSYFDVTVNSSSDGLPLDPIDAQKSYPATSLTVPLGLGVRYTMDRLVVGIEGTLNAGLNDYLDGISRSGNHDDNDWYDFYGVTIAYRIGAQPKSGNIEEPEEGMLEESSAVENDEY